MNIINNGFIEDVWSDALSFAKRYFSQHAPQMQAVIEEFLLSIKAQKTPISHNSKNKAEPVEALQKTPERSRSPEKSTFLTPPYIPLRVIPDTPRSRVIPDTPRSRVIPDTPRSCVTGYATMSDPTLVGKDVEDASPYSPSSKVLGATEHPYKTPYSQELCSQELF